MTYFDGVIPRKLVFDILTPTVILVPENLLIIVTIDGPKSHKFIGRNLHFMESGTYTLWYYANEDAKELRN